MTISGARTLHRLSARFVATVAAPGRHADGGNLYLSVSPNGGRRWVFLFRWGGKTREMGLGSARAVSLAIARKKAAAARELLAQDQNPLVVRRVETAVPTFGDVADALIEAMKPSWKNEKHVAQWKTTLTVDAAPLRNLLVSKVTTDDVLGVIKPIWNIKPETAHRLRGRIERVIDAAKAKGQFKGENPARWRGHLSTVLPARTKLSRGHHAAMPFAEVPAFIQQLRSEVTISNLALELVILTAARSGEVRGAAPAELDLRDKVWTIPAVRMKAQREHRVPLTNRMLEILEQAASLGFESDQFVFSGRAPGTGLSVMALTMALRRAGAGQFTVHGFRSSFRDWVFDATTFPRELAEAALAHTLDDATEAAYRRGDALARRRKLMNAWEAFLICSPKENKVVALEKKLKATG
ncbi:MAG: integrase arm-type DNA-binding domain-containing protein [Pseudorhodoplanes sp.]|nr:integrase arm-type DNA-binding domain-containing protein [Pseudorhodoplanes sp.]